MEAAVSGRKMSMAAVGRMAWVDWGRRRRMVVSRRGMVVGLMAVVCMEYIVAKSVVVKTKRKEGRIESSYI